MAIFNSYFDITGGYSNIFQASRGVHRGEVLRRTGHVDGAAACRVDHGEDLLRAVGAAAVRPWHRKQGKMGGNSRGFIELCQIFFEIGMNPIS